MPNHVENGIVAVKAVPARSQTKRRVDRLHVMIGADRAGRVRRQEALDQWPRCRSTKCRQTAPSAGLGKLRMGARVCSDQSAPSGLPSIDLSAIRIGRRLLEFGIVS